MTTGAIILAAGLSSRMGAFKPLLRLGRSTLIEHCTQLFRCADIHRIVIVAGHRAEDIAAMARSLGVDWVVNQAFRDGMFSSVQAGVRALAEDTEALFILPVDIPLVRSATITLLREAFARDPQRPVIPHFADQPGHPPLLPAAIYPQILNQGGSGGLRALLKRFDCTPVPVWDQGVLQDADTPVDAETLFRRHARLGVPTRDETEELAKLFVPEQGRAHGRMVAEIAMRMGQTLATEGHRLDLDLLFAGGWLHDLAKGQPNHGRRAAATLTSLGLPAVAAVVAEHEDLAPPENHRLEERHLVCLADKTVSGHSLVEPVERYQAKLARYADDREALAVIRQRMENGLALQRLFENSAGHRLMPLLREAVS